MAEILQPPRKPVSVSLRALQSQAKQPISTTTLLEAFGPSSLGIILVSDLPEHFPALRSRVLGRISHLAHLPGSALGHLTNEEAKYLVGWSHGKETLRPGVVDIMKGSYYVNCAFDEQSRVLEQMRCDWAGFEEYTAPNVWPDEEADASDMRGFRKDVEELVSLIVDVAALVAQVVDRFAQENIENYPAPTRGNGYLEAVVRGSCTSKARLLHYFPSTPSTKETQKPDSSNGSITDDAVAKSAIAQAKSEHDSWCATHKDHSCLTGLTSAAFFDESSPSTRYQELAASPSPSAGLYILDRQSHVHKVSIPKDCLAFQTGEALERITKGRLKAVPHFVRGMDVNELAGDVGSQKRIARNTLAVFTQPNLSDVVDLDNGLSFGEFARGIVRDNTTT